MGVPPAAVQVTLHQLRYIKPIGRQAAKESLPNHVQEQDSRYAPQSSARFQFPEHYDSGYA